jgi:hypothetical protein
LQDDIDIVRTPAHPIPDKRSHGVDVAEQLVDSFVDHQVDMISPSHVITTFLALEWLSRRIRVRALIDP